MLILVLLYTTREIRKNLSSFPNSISQSRYGLSSTLYKSIQALNLSNSQYTIDIQAKKRSVSEVDGVEILDFKGEERGFC